jgi:glucan phosphorylase
VIVLSNLGLRPPQKPTRASTSVYYLSMEFLIGRLIERDDQRTLKEIAVQAMAG